MELNSIKNIIEESLKEIGYELYDISFKKEMGDLVLEVVVDKDDPIDMNMIVEVSEFISNKLDEIDPIEDEYVLNVSSLGAEKPLSVEKLPKYVGNFIHLHLKNPVDGENIYEGILENVSDDKLVLSYKIKTRTKKIEVELTNIYKVRLAIKF
jgi:ribosome maturation factor RimP